ncbi:MAG TPA: protein kinase [Kofleriaceae bacterium]|nr:protein kinase [Kofleriaceae bacterium]
MDCLDETTVTLFLDRKLTGERRARCEAHIDGCPSCRRVVAELARQQPETDTSRTIVDDDANATTIADGGPRDVPARLPGDRIDRYVLVREVGAGAMGTVFEAHDPMLDRKVALKLLGGRQSETSRARLVREAQAMARVASPNVVAVYDAGVVDDHVYIAMELVAGGTLRGWLRARHDWREILRVFEAAGRGLAAAHERGLVHRDFKPDNVLIEGDHVRVADFGLAAPLGTRGQLASAAEESPLDHSLTVTGAIVGTPAYMAPEQHAGQPVDARSDQFSFCVALYEALYGQRPFAGDTPGALANEVLAGRVRPPAGKSPAWLRGVVLRGLARDPDARFPSMQALLDQLARARTRSRGRWIAATVLGLGLAGTATGLALRPASSTAELCPASPEPAVRYDAAKIRAAFAAIAPNGDQIATRALEPLEAWPHKIAQLRDFACRTSRIDGTESPELADLRVECTRRSVEEVTALLHELEKPTPALVERAVEGMTKATDLARCNSRRQLLATKSLPHDAKLRAEAERLRQRLATALAALFAGRHGEARNIATEVGKTADTDKLPGVSAEAYALLGKAETEDEHLLDARAAYQRALVASEAAGNDELRAELYMQLALLETKLDRTADGERWAAQARALVEHMGADELQWELLYLEASFAGDRGDHATAIVRAREALAAYRKLPDADDAGIALLLHEIGSQQSLAGELRAAEQSLREALSLYEKLHGKDHPALMDTLDQLSGTALSDGRSEDAVAFATRAYNIAMHMPGDNAARLAKSVAFLALALHDLGRNEQALGYVDRGLDGMARSFGTESSMYAWILMVRSRILTALARYPEALADAERGLALARKTKPGSTDVATGLETLAEVQYARGKLPEVIRALEEALQVYDQQPHVDELEVFHPVGSLGQAHLEAGNPRKALPYLERALALVSDADRADPIDRAEAQVMLARALIALHQDRPRTVELLRGARAIYDASKLPGAADEAKQVRALLASIGEN